MCKKYPLTEYVFGQELTLNHFNRKVKGVMMRIVLWIIIVFDGVEYGLYKLQMDQVNSQSQALDIH